MNAAVSMIIALAVATSPNSGADRPPEFREQVGSWTVLGDVELGRCLMIRDDEGATRMVIAARPASTALDIALTNDAWMSLESDSIRILASFSDRRGNIQDAWNLDAVSTAHDQGGPRINFTIHRARNDGASFPDNMARAQTLMFFTEDALPVARFDLTDSAKAIKVLVLCREILRQDPEFDPFGD